MRDPKEIYKLIEQSSLSKEEQNTLHDCYREAHIKVTKKAQAKLQKVKQWRERKIGKLQNKVLRRLR